ncbi:glycoside hydrolase family 43 protein [Flavisolibacter ginsenosidimutans]|uniref:Family 43 glycosylhydrolase n=1 Tax=Flavisolibacter ginsenosidimutans TaxID=661481 RepID=A0A5B8UIS0_9BACT|nr:glycoside hydrolase family 43 protein [Flavisolibacter ginsenosidimutans]QEC56286.1 family 43 glycosylhydrolase [Flavisolibacter ginsenosidimutans]
MKKIFFTLLLLPCLLCRAQSVRTYTNPVLAGFYPDPSICRVGDDYYIVNSSFAYFPGLPVFHSKDLVSWKQIGNAMDRPEQLPLLGAGVSRGLFAPTIRYYKGLYYILCTLIDKGGNFVITAKNPAGPWSNPVYLHNVTGIDPSLFFDEGADKSYIIYNSDPPEKKSLWNGHRSIRMIEFDYRNMKPTGEEKLLVNGGVDTAKHPVWIEGPHIYRINDWYYLMCAEGGTGYNHSEVIFRSKSVGGPYVPWKDNPILTQRQLNPARKNPITTTGHADLVQTQNGTWYAVFLGCRPYEGNHYNIGRETFLIPVTWTNDGWPVMTKEMEEVQYRYPLPLPNVNKNPVNPYSGNFSFSDDFSKEPLDLRYIFLRTPTDKWYNTKDKAGWLSVQLRPQTVSGKENPSFVGFRQQHNYASATTKLSFTPTADNEKAGMVIFQNETHFYYLCKSLVNGNPAVQLYQSANDTMTLLTSQPLPSAGNDVYLRIEPKGAVYTMSFSTDKKKWTELKNVDARFLSTETAGGFVGCVFGLYATSMGKPSSGKAYYDWFTYKGDDAVFR